MTHVGDGPHAIGHSSPLKSTGDLLAERYRLDQHVNDDSAGRQVWRGVDIVLRRPVAIVLRHPGGAHAEEMLTAAVAASRVNHSNLIGVYDAIDQGTHAFVVREWIDGAAVRDLVASEGTFDADRTTYVLHSIAEAVAALHTNGIAHGNIHPGTVMVANDGRVVLADARVDGNTSAEGDVRGIGACGYFMLTGHWPAEAGRSTLPDARRDDTGRVVAPRRVRAGIPTYLDDLVTDLLDPALALPSAPVLAAELPRLDTGDQLLFGGSGTFRFADETPGPSRSSTPRLVAVGGTALALIIAGMVLGIKALNANADPEASSAPPSSAPSPTTANPQPITLRADQVRIVDPEGDRKETDDAELVIDGDLDTEWKTDGYKNKGTFGGSKPGMGILIKLDKPMRVTSVKVTLNAPGASAVLRTGKTDEEDTNAGDRVIHETYTEVGTPLLEHPGTVMVFPSDLTTQYLLVWITELPYDSSTDRYRIGVQEITVEAL